MDLQEAEDLANKLIGEWFPPHIWTFRWNNRRASHGLCDYGSFTIELSRPLTAANTREAVEDTIRHEIAHALNIDTDDVHGPNWRRWAVTVGADPAHRPEKVGVPARWQAFCPACSQPRVTRNRLTAKMRRALEGGDYCCEPCAREHSNGKWDERFVLRLRKMF